MTDTAAGLTGAATLYSIIKSRKHRKIKNNLFLFKEICRHIKIRTGYSVHIKKKTIWWSHRAHCWCIFQKITSTLALGAGSLGDIRNADPLLLQGLLPQGHLQTKVGGGHSKRYTTKHFYILCVLMFIKYRLTEVILFSHRTFEFFQKN